MFKKYVYKKEGCVRLHVSLRHPLNGFRLNLVSKVGGI